MKYLSIVVAALLLTNCSWDQTDPSAKCSAEELYDQVADKCVPRQVAPVDMGDTGSKEDVTITPDVVEDKGPDLPAKNCDKDFDGELSKECGGNDCDDNVRQMSPNFDEVCDDLDNNCDGIVNNGITCSFFAHTGRAGERQPELYRVDPFLKTATLVGDMIDLRGNGTLLDIDSHPNGILFGVTADELFKFNESTKKWSRVGDLGQDVGATGLAIDSEGTAFITAKDEVYTVDLNSGQAVLLGKIGSGFYSSGDAVVNKQDTLYMSSKDRPENGEEADPDVLVRIDRATGLGTAIGPTSHFRIYGLVAGWGELWGLTAGSFDEPNGQLIKIDPNTGASETVHTFEGIRWFGSASDPSR